MFSGNFYNNNRSAAFTLGYRQLALAHHFEPLADIVQRDMRLVVVCGVKVGTVVFDDDFAAAVRLSGLDIDMERVSLQLHAVLDRVFHKGLQRRRRHAKAAALPVYSFSILRNRYTLKTIRKQLKLNSNAEKQE